MTTTPTELYRRVYINGEEINLPKKAGYYIASCKKYAVLEYHYEDDVKREWLKDIEWYLQPVERSKEQEDTEFRDILITKYQLFVRWILRRTPEIEQSQRGKDHLKEIDEIEAKIREQEFQPSKTVQPERTEHGRTDVMEWYAKELNKQVVEFDDYDLHICRVLAKYKECHTITTRDLNEIDNNREERQ